MHHETNFSQQHLARHGFIMYGAFRGKGLIVI
jgi:hypothetical protein